MKLCNMEANEDDNNNITSQQEEIIDKLQNSYLIDPSSLEEINKAIKVLKNNKAPGFDKVSLQNCTSWKLRVKHNLKNYKS